MKRKIIISVLLALALAAVCIFGYRWFADNKLPNLKGNKELFVYPNTTVEEVLDSLSAAVSRPRSLRRTFEAKDVERYMGTKVFLQSWVKVKENWRDQDALLRNFGYHE